MGQSTVICSECKKPTRQVGSIGGQYFCLDCYSAILVTKNNKFGKKKIETNAGWKKHPVFAYSVRAG